MEMEAQLIYLLSTFQPLQNRLALIYLCLIVAWRFTTTGRAILMSSYVLRFAASVAVVVIASYLLKLASYIIYPNYFDHLQPTVASIGWLGMHGHTLYPDWATGDVYGLLYGPVLFLVNGLALLVLPTLIASKIPGVFCLIAAFGVTLVALKQRAVSNLTSLLFLSSLVMLFVPFGVFAYWNRAEPFLVFISALALPVAFRLRPLEVATIIGVLGGLAVGFKLHGFLYLLPAGIVSLARAENRPIYGCHRWCW